MKLILFTTFCLSLQLVSCVDLSQTCNRGGCGNPCLATGETCCFCDGTVYQDRDACFCCPKGYKCCPASSWSGMKATCCPTDHNCTDNGRCTKAVNKPSELSQGTCGPSCYSKFYATCDDSFINLYIDGIQQSLPNGNNWTIADVLLLSATAKVIVMSGQNTWYKAGFLVGSEPSSLLNNGWRCCTSTEYNEDWSKPDYDDSTWMKAVEDEDNSGNSTRKSVVEGIPQKNKYMWCNNPGNSATDQWNKYCTCRNVLYRNTY